MPSWNKKSSLLLILTCWTGLMVSGCRASVVNSGYTPGYTSTPNTGTYYFSASSHAFSQLAIGANTPQTITISNGGSAPSTNAHITVSGTGFTIGSNTCGSSANPITLPQGTSCTFQAVFAPTTAGSRTGQINYSYHNGVQTMSGVGATLSGTAGANLEVPIEILDSGVASAGAAATFERSRTNLDTTAYDGTVTYYFEIVGINPDGADRAITLVDNGGATVATVTLLSTDTTITRKRAVFTPTAGVNNYRIRMPAHTTSALSVYTARILVQQTNATKTKIYMPLIANSLNGVSSIDSGYTNPLGTSSLTYNAGSAIASTVTYIFNKTESKWATIPNTGTPWTLDVIIFAAPAGETAYVSLFNKTLNSQITTTELSTTANVLTPLSVSFANNTTDFRDGHDFDLRIKSGLGGLVYVVHAGLWLTLTNLSKGEVYYRLAKWSSQSALTVSTHSRVLLNTGLFSNPTAYGEAVALGAPVGNSIIGDITFRDDGTNFSGTGAGSTSLFTLPNIPTIASLLAAGAINSRERLRSSAFTPVSGNDFVSNGCSIAFGNCRVAALFLIVGFE